MLTHPSPCPISSAAFLTQTVCLDDTTVKFEIWDTAGQERYHSLAPMYYRGAQAAIVVYDITNEARSSTFQFFMQFSWHCTCHLVSQQDAARALVQQVRVWLLLLLQLMIACIGNWYNVFYLQESFARAKNWVKELQRQASPNIVIALSGNKADLANKRAVDFQVRLNKLCFYSQSYFVHFWGTTTNINFLSVFVQYDYIQNIQVIKIH